MKWTQIALTLMILSFGSTGAWAQDLRLDLLATTADDAVETDLSGDALLAHEISRTEFDEAYRRYRSGRRLKTFGVSAIVSGAVFLTVGVAVHVAADRWAWSDERSGPDDFERRQRDRLFITAAGFFVGGLVMYRIGHDKQYTEKPIVDAYKEQERSRRARDESSSTALSVGPLFVRGGGGTRLQLKF